MAARLLLLLRWVALLVLVLVKLDFVDVLLPEVTAVAVLVALSALGREGLLVGAAMQ